MRTSGRRANTPAGRGHPMTDEATADGQHSASEPGPAPARAAAPVPEEASTSAGTQARDSDFVQSLDRGPAVIRAFGPDRERLSLSEVARATGLTRAAARRFLLTLVKLGYVRSDGREFSLRPRVLELGYAYLSGLALAEGAPGSAPRLLRPAGGRSPPRPAFRPAPCPPRSTSRPTRAATRPRRC